jgi:hypothetical protein
MAKEAGFVERTSPITGFRFFLTLTNGLLNTADGTLNQLVAFLNSSSGIDVSPQAFDKRISDSGKEFLEMCLKRAIKMSVHQTNIDSGVLSFLKHIYIIDSTNFDLHPSLKEIFKGSGGSASESSMRIQFVYDYLTGEMYIRIGDADTADAVTLNDIVKGNDLSTDGNSLFLGDLGYFKTETFLILNGRKDQFFLSKLKYKVKIYDTEGNEIDLLEKLKSKPDTIDINIKIGQLNCRLIVQKLSPETVSAKIRRTNKSNKKGKAISKEYKLFLSYGIFITNLPEQYNFKTLFTIYRIRWQIELIFKTWKSILNINKIRSAKESRIMCEVYGKLIIASLTDKIYLTVQLIYQVNLSYHKSLQLMKSLAVKWGMAIIEDTEAHKQFIGYMSKQMVRFCKKNKQKNKKNIETLLQEELIDGQNIRGKNVA